MIELELNGSTYNLPTSFSEVNIETYSKIVSIDSTIEGVERYVKVISILTGIEEEIVKTIKLEHMNLIQNNIQFMFKNDNIEIVDRFEIDGVKYGFNYELGKITFGEFIDLDDFSRPEEINKNMDILLAILYRPIKEINKDDYEILEYDDETVRERADIFKTKLTMDKALGGLVFFSLLNATTILNTPDYSSKKLMMEMRELMNLTKAQQTEMKRMNLDG